MDDIICLDLWLVHGLISTLGASVNCRVIEDMSLVMALHYEVLWPEGSGDLVQRDGGMGQKSIWTDWENRTTLGVVIPLNGGHEPGHQEQGVPGAVRGAGVAPVPVLHRCSHPSPICPLVIQSGAVHWVMMLLSQENGRGGQLCAWVHQAMHWTKACKHEVLLHAEPLYTCYVLH